MKVDLAHLMRLRLVVARYGEMDIAGWWNTKGMLGRTGSVVLQRGFSRTFYFTQSRVVFAVAKSRCKDLFDPPNCMTLWKLPVALEEHFEETWHSWLDQADEWVSFFQDLQEIKGGGGLLQVFEKLGLLTLDQQEMVQKLRLSAEGKAVALPGTCKVSDETLTLLAAGFSLGKPNSPAIPYARLEV